MASAVDLHILPIHRRGGQDQASLPGVHLAVQPRRLPRNRRGEKLLLHLAFSGTATFGEEGQTQLLEKLAQTYFQTSGSVTTALRTTAESINQFLFDRNLRGASRGLQATGLFTILVLRNDRLYIAQSGPTHIFIVQASGCQELHDPSRSGPGLGMGRSTPIRFHHLDAQAGDLLILAAVPPPAWTPRTLQTAHGRDLRTVHRGLLRAAEAELQAVIVAVRAGQGQAHLLAPLPTPRFLHRQPQEPEAAPQDVDGPDEGGDGRSAEPSESRPAALEPDQAEEPPDEETGQDPVDVVEESIEPGPAAAAAEAEIPQTSEGPEQPRAPLEAVVAEPDAQSDPGAPANGPLPTTASKDVPAASVARARLAADIAAETSAPAVQTAPISSQAVADQPVQAPSISDSEAPAPEPKESRRPPRERKPVVGPMLLAVGRAFRAAARQLLYLLRSLLTRLLPGADLFTIPSSVMAFTAVAVPLVLVTVASVVYLQRGRLGQFDGYVAQAQLAREEAASLTDQTEMRSAWNEVLINLDQAESIQITEQTQALRLHAQTQLDQLDGTERLNFQPALAEPLSESVEVVRMEATSDAIFMLNGNSGNVIRAWLSGRGYEIDAEFSCGPGDYGGHILSEIVDIAALPKNNALGAEMLAMDANGNVAYCRSGRPLLSQSLPPPDSNWGDPIAFALDGDTLYILDPQTNAIWIYPGDDYTFVDRPRLFFDEQVPSLQGVIDLTVDRGEVYLLYADGHLVVCTFGFGAQATRCSEPALYTDSRQGTAQQTQVIEGTEFSQIAFTQPPDPSIYLFDPLRQAIYHFSLRMNLQRLYRPQHPALSGDVGPPSRMPASGFAFSPNRTVFLAVGNQIYVAALP